MSKGREENLCLLLSALAWYLLFFPHNAGILVPICMSDASGGQVFIEFKTHKAPDLKQAMHHHSLMVMAMMLPLITPLIDQVRSRVVQLWRIGAIFFFIAGYILIWGLAGVLLSALHLGIELSGSFRLSLFLLALTFACLWQSSHQKAKALIACHSTVPLPARSFTLIMHSFHYGIKRGEACVKTCGNLMFLPAIFGSSTILMLTVFIIAICERFGIISNKRIIQLAIIFIGLVVLMSNGLLWVV